MASESSSKVSDALALLPLELPLAQNNVQDGTIAPVPELAVVDTIPPRSKPALPAKHANEGPLIDEAVAKRLVIANFAETENVLVLHNECSGVITRAMMRSGSTGNITDTHQFS